jgi:lysophospholipase L1-like esterase
MQFLSTRAGAQLVVAAIAPVNRRQYDLVQGIARDYGLPFLDTSALVASDETLWLPGDGHPSPEGARRLAAIVAAYLKSPPADQPGRRVP